MKRFFDICTSNVSPPVWIWDYMAHPLRRFLSVISRNSAAMAKDNKSATGKSGSDAAQKNRQTSGDSNQRMNEPSKDAIGKGSPARSGTTALAEDSRERSDADKKGQEEE